MGDKDKAKQIADTTGHDFRKIDEDAKNRREADRREQEWLANRGDAIGPTLE